MIGGVIRLFGLGNIQVQRAGDQVPPRHIVPVNESHCGPGSASTRGAPDAVQIHLVVLGGLVVDNVGHIGDVNASCGNVRGNHDVNLAVLQCPQCLFAGPLAQIAMQGAHGKSAIFKVFGEPGSGALGLNEDNGSPSSLRLQNPRQDLHLVHRVSAISELFDLGDGCALVIRVLSADMGGLTHKSPSESNDSTGHGRREQHGVARRGHV